MLALAVGDQRQIVEADSDVRMIGADIPGTIWWALVTPRWGDSNGHDW